MLSQPCLTTYPPITDKIPKAYMLRLISNIKQKSVEENLSAQEALNLLEQAVLDYDDKVVSIFSHKPKVKQAKN